MNWEINLNFSMRLFYTGQGDLFGNTRLDTLMRQRFGGALNNRPPGQQPNPQTPQPTSNAATSAAAGTAANTPQLPPRQVGTVTVPVIGPFPTNTGVQNPSRFMGMGRPGPFRGLGQPMPPQQRMTPFGRRPDFNTMLARQRQQQIQQRRIQQSMFPFLQPPIMPQLPQFGLPAQGGINNLMLREGEQMLILPNSMAETLMSMRSGNRRELRRLASLGIPRSLLSTFSSQPGVFDNLPRQTVRSNVVRASTSIVPRSKSGGALLCFAFINTYI